jgi:hypothetical protein
MNGSELALGEVGVKDGHSREELKNRPCQPDVFGLWSEEDHQVICVQRQVNLIADAHSGSN